MVGFCVVVEEERLIGMLISLADDFIADAFEEETVEFYVYSESLQQRARKACADNGLCSTVVIKLAKPQEIIRDELVVGMGVYDYTDLGPLLSRSASAYFEMDI